MQGFRVSGCRVENFGIRILGLGAAGLGFARRSRAESRFLWFPGGFASHGGFLKIRDTLNPKPFRSLEYG